MNQPQPVKELPIDLTSTHYMEEQALAVALAKATPGAEAGKVQRLAQLRDALMAQRSAHMALLTQKRHARGEIYSDAKVKSINAMGPSQADRDRMLGNYQGRPDAMGVLKLYARAAFGNGLANKRSQLAHASADIVQDMRHTLALEEAFGAEWLATIGDPVFSAEVAKARRAATLMFRQATQAMLLVTLPPSPQADAVDADELGKAWNPLDKLAKALGVASLATFVGVTGQAAQDSAPVQDVLVTVDALLVALADKGQKMTGKKAAADVLNQVKDALLCVQPQQGHAYFEVDL